MRPPHNKYVSIAPSQWRVLRINETDLRGPQPARLLDTLIARPWGLTRDSLGTRSSGCGHLTIESLSPVSVREYSTVPTPITELQCRLISERLFFAFLRDLLTKLPLYSLMLKMPKAPKTSRGELSSVLRAQICGMREAGMSFGKIWAQNSHSCYDNQDNLGK